MQPTPSSSTPPPPPLPPPRPFRDACDRWAQGHPTAYDTAVLTSLSTSTPLPPLFDPLPVGFLPTTRLPPTPALALFHSAKNEARAHFHRGSTHANNSTVLAYLQRTSHISEDNAFHFDATTLHFPTSLAAAPARAGLLQAAHAALGASHTIAWSVGLHVLTAAGLDFCKATVKAGWFPSFDLEASSTTTCTNSACSASASGCSLGMSTVENPVVVDWKSHRKLTDEHVAKTIVALTEANVCDDVIIPAGNVSFNEGEVGFEREGKARADLIPRLVWKARIAIELHRKQLLIVAGACIVATVVYWVMF